MTNNPSLIFYRCEYKIRVRWNRSEATVRTFYDYPAAHWTHLRTVNPIESTFATVRLRPKVTKGAGARRRGLVMAYKLLDAAQERWRRINSPQFVALVRAGVESKTESNKKRPPTDRGIRLAARPDPRDLAISR